MRLINAEEIKFLIDDPLSPGFACLYELYDSIFTLPGEKESIDGFIKTSAFNKNEVLQNKYGPFAELWIKAVDVNQNIVGGVNFVVFCLPDISCVSVHIIYIFTDAEVRGKGIATKLLLAAESFAADWLRRRDVKYSDMYFFCEQNVPELMNEAEYIQDSMDSGIDPYERLMWWVKRGYRRLAIDYVQPPLSVNSEPCRILSLNVRSDNDYIDASIVYSHLCRFFYITVLKNPRIRSGIADQVLNNIKTRGKIELMRRNIY